MQTDCWHARCMDTPPFFTPHQSIHLKVLLTAYGHDPAIWTPRLLVQLSASEQWLIQHYFNWKYNRAHTMNHPVPRAEGAFFA